jgi:hypothetical protein
LTSKFDFTSDPALYFSHSVFHLYHEKIFSLVLIPEMKKLLKLKKNKVAFLLFHNFVYESEELFDFFISNGLMENFIELLNTKDVEFQFFHISTISVFFRFMVERGMKNELLCVYNALVPFFKNNFSEKAFNLLEKLLGSSDELHLYFEIDYYEILSVLTDNISNFKDTSLFRVLFKQKFPFDNTNIHVRYFMEILFKNLEKNDLEAILKFEFYFHLLNRFIEGLGLNSRFWIPKVLKICIFALNLRIKNKLHHLVMNYIDLLKLIVKVFQEDVEEMISTELIEILFKMTNVS